MNTDPIDNGDGTTIASDIFDEPTPQPDYPPSTAPGGRPSVILATSNGTGMGHLARQAAVALTFDSTIEPIVFSLSTALPVIARHGLRGEYCPSHQRGWMPHPLWHRYLRDRIHALLSETGASALVFDGVAPYIGLLRARREHPDVAFCWVRRGMWQRGANERALAARPFFDLVIEPGDLAADADEGATAPLDDVTRVDPITLLEATDVLPRDQAAAQLGLDPDRPAALVTLGAGSINDVRTPGVAAIQTFLSDPAWQVAVIRAPLATGGIPASDADRVHELVDVYPLARYLQAFDAAVSAAGYNAVHELLLSQIPTLLVPNRATATDDQVARARWAARVGLALYADATPDSVENGARQLLDRLVRDRLGVICSTLGRPSGARHVARLLGDLSSTFDSHHPSVTERVRAQDLALRDAAMRGLGPSGTTLVRRALGRGPTGGPPRQLDVEPVVTDRMDAETLRRNHPVEHLLSGSTEHYRARRIAIARRCYYWSADGSAPPEC